MAHEPGSEGSGKVNRGKTSFHYTEAVQKDPLVRMVDPKSVRQQLSRRGLDAIASHVLWAEAQARMLDRFSYIRLEPRHRLDYGIAQFGRPIEKPSDGFDLIWSVGLLAHLSDLRSTLGFWAKSLAPEGLLMIATLGPDSFRALAMALADFSQERHVPGYPDMHDIGDALVSFGLANPVMDAEWIELTYSSAESALQDLRLLGGNPLLDRPKGLCTRQWRARVLGAIESLRKDGEIRLPVELVFGHAWAQGPSSKSASSDQAEVKPVRWLGKTPGIPPKT
jgi:SAM-dependent methyltransferase